MSDPDKGAEIDAAVLSEWQQGDYTTDCKELIFAEGLSKDGFLEMAPDLVKGIAVVTQTCDVVNMAPGKEYVVVCPLVELSEKALQDVAKARTPLAATLEHGPKANVVVDLGRMMTIHKSLLVKLTRSEGFSSDARRIAFAEALERKHGRFAFPDDFSAHVLGKLRDRVLSAHGKQESDHGRVYRSIATTRVQAIPGWAGDDIIVRFYFVLEGEASREADRGAIAKTLDEHIGKIQWPNGFKPNKPAYILTTVDEMTAAEWITSQSVDWDFISAVAKRGEKK